jgi:hypothetical protein
MVLNKKGPKLVIGSWLDGLGQSSAGYLFRRSVKYTSAPDEKAAMVKVLKATNFQRRR